jgi:hypothetical protein
MHKDLKYKCATQEKHLMEQMLIPKKYAYLSHRSL